MAERKERQYISASAQQRCKAGVRKTHQEFCEELTQLNFQITPLEEYVSAYTKIKFRCDECGYEWATAPTNITNKKHGCPLCARKRLAQQKLKTTDEFKQTLAEINPQIEVVGEYVSNSTKIECRCLLCGHIWKSLPTNLIKGRSCPECSHTSTSFVEQTLRLSFERIVGADRVLSRDCNTIGIFLLSDNLFEKFKNYACAVLETVEEGFVFVGGAELATEIPYGIVILQGQLTQKVVQFLEAVADLRWVAFVGFKIGLVKLIQDGFVVAVTGVERMSFYVCLQSLGKHFIHGDTSWLTGASPEAR